jgi:two-component system, sensor histidine kinase and response regulator
LELPLIKKYKILLVEDELNLREAISEYLNTKNYEVISAENGQEALDILDYLIPDLIVCDLMMPVMDGHIFHEIFLENKTLNAIPFIFLTAKNSKKIQKKCLLDGADDFISKPFKFDDLIETIQSKLIKFEKIKNSYNNLYTGSKDTFSDEINTPLNEILNSVKHLMENEQDLEKNNSSSLYETIKISGERLKRTMENVILYQNIKNNTIEFDSEAHTDIQECFNKVQKKISLSSEKQGKRIRSEIKPANLKINFKYLEFILFELIDNALKYSKKNKKINIYGRIYSKEFYELNIVDYGIGFSPEEIKQIQATRQFNHDINRQSGLGLGLFLSKVLVLKSNGIFSIVSKKDHNTSIKIILPLENIN